MCGERLRQARIKAGLTLTQVAVALFTSHTTISRYENDKRKVDPPTMLELCKLYNVSADYILGLPKDMPYPDDED